MPYTLVPSPRMPRSRRTQASGLVPLAPDAEECTDGWTKCCTSRYCKKYPKGVMFNQDHVDLSFSGLTPRLQHRREVWC